MTLSPSGARIQGDDYHHLFAWYHLIRTLDPTADVTGIGIEASDAGNVDDVVVRHRSTPDEHYQVKYSVDLADTAAARALAGQVRDLVAAEVGATGARRVHLFLATPGGAALLLGYVWNRMPATQVYEDLGPGQGYAPAFLIPG